MRTQVWIIALSFIFFGVIAWVLTQTFSLAYIGLIFFGVMGLIIGQLSGK